MRYSRAERWARGNSFIHRFHPSAKIICALAILMGIASVRHFAIAACSLYLSILISLTLLAQLRPLELLRGAAKVLPFAGLFAIFSALAGDKDRSVMLLTRSYASCYCALLLVGTTPIPSLIGGLASIRVPSFLLLVMQFLFRYVVVLFAEAAAIRDAGASRGGSFKSLQFRQSGAAAAVLFLRAYQRSWAIHQAMIARGFDGHIPALHPASFKLKDAGAVATICLLAVFLGVAFH